MVSRARGIARALLIFGNLWWMYGGYAWPTNASPPQGSRQRVLLLVGMAGFLIASLGIPDGFGAGGIALGIGYLVVTVVHDVMLLRPMEGSFLRAMGWLGPAKLITALVVVAAGFTRGWLQWSLWGAAFLLHWSTPYLTRPEVVALRSKHLVERHGLIVLIALGESVVAIGLGAERVGVPAGLAATAVLALATLARCGGCTSTATTRRPSEPLSAAPDDRRAWLALHVYSYGFLALLGGIIVSAGMRRAIVDFNRPVSAATSAMIAGGVAAYPLGTGDDSGPPPHRVPVDSSGADRACPPDDPRREARLAAGPTRGACLPPRRRNRAGGSLAVGGKGMRHQRSSNDRLGRPHRHPCHGMAPRTMRIGPGGLLSS